MATGESPISLDIQKQVEIWRQKVRDNTITQEEMREAITVLRAGRLNAATTAKPTGSKKQTAASIDTDKLLDLL